VSPRKLRLATRVVHPPAVAGADRDLTPAIHQSSVYTANDLADAIAMEADGAPISSYTRAGNPTVSALEAAIADLEEGEAALAFPSGMAAMTAVFLATLHTGDAVVVSEDAYADTITSLQMLAVQMDLRVVTAGLCSASIHELIAAVRPRMVVAESISNPMLRVPDLARLAGAVHAHGGILVVDNTIATPVNLRPGELGADIVVHSASKYLAGHYSVVAGAVVAGADVAAEIRRWRTTFGSCLDPHAAWTVLQGMQTLALRVARQNETALLVARLLDEWSLVRNISYPLLPSHADGEVAQRQLTGGGGVVTFQLDTDDVGVARFLQSFEVARLAVSLGGTKTLVEAPLLMSHTGGPPPSARDASGWVMDGATIRMSVGIEDPTDILEDVLHALRSITGGAGRVAASR
jgi:cystathionine beta-lyase/cystathionine gamma-synthase